jgi:hypothetical protein
MAKRKSKPTYVQHEEFLRMAFCGEEPTSRAKNQRRAKVSRESFHKAALGDTNWRQLAENRKEDNEGLIQQINKIEDRCKGGLFVAGEDYEKLRCALKEIDALCVAADDTRMWPILAITRPILDSQVRRRSE